MGEHKTLSKAEWKEKYPESPRFWSKVKKTNTCWLWIGGLAGKGYGTFPVGSKKDGTHRHIYAHRWSYQNSKGEIPLNFDVDHLCRNPICVNPDHLEAVTHKENCLRGIGFSALNARKTHCPNGHEYNHQNTHFSKEGYRHCRICNRNNKRKEWQLKQLNQGATNDTIS